MPREGLCRHPPDIGDVEAEEHTPKRDRLGCLDRVDDVGGAPFLKAVQLDELFLRQAVEVGQRPQQTEVPEPADELLAYAVDVGRGHDPVVQRLEAARWTRPVRTPMHGLALAPDAFCDAQRAA